MEDEKAQTEEERQLVDASEALYNRIRSSNTKKGIARSHMKSFSEEYD